MLKEKKQRFKKLSLRPSDPTRDPTPVPSQCHARETRPDVRHRPGHVLDTDSLFSRVSPTPSANSAIPRPYASFQASPPLSSNVSLPHPMATPHPPLIHSSMVPSSTPRSPCNLSLAPHPPLARPVPLLFPLAQPSTPASSAFLSLANIYAGSHEEPSKGGNGHRLAEVRVSRKRMRNEGETYSVYS